MACIGDWESSDASNYFKKIYFLINSFFSSGVFAFKLFALLMKFGFMRVSLFLLCKSHFFAKVFLFLALYCISDLSIKNNILRKIINRANRAKRV